ncbi:hypothetical protein B0H14DRAFT_2616750 [Mycena olivaceomarginata]|nr:hypothetical protein B0H14DRAFT_2616750 [Mycena olivaceomarginata]
MEGTIETGRPNVLTTLRIGISWRRTSSQNGQARRQGDLGHEGTTVVAARLKSGAEVGRTMDSELHAHRTEDPSRVRSLSTQRQGYHASAGRRGHSVECLSGVHEISKVCLHTVYSHNTHRVTIPRRRPDGNQCEVPSTTHPFPANSASSKPGETIVNSSAVNTSPARRLRLRSISTLESSSHCRVERGIENSKRGAQAELNALDISTKSGPPDQKDAGTET